MWLAAARRFAILVVGACAVTAALSLLVGLLLGSSVVRSLALGFYLGGSFVIIAGFFVGNRGPARVQSEGAGTGGAVGFFGERRLRWATLREQSETINSSAVCVTLGLVLIAIGFAFDAQHSLL